MKMMTDEKGFTLVELAVVMIIIGLLIGGILKGQELITNAQITSTVAQMKGIDAAASTFRDQYSAFPGDMANASTRLQNCAADPCNNGDGDGRLDATVGAAPAAGNEGTYFFNMMHRADLLTGMDGSNTVAFGQALPTASIGGGYTAGHSDNAAPTGFDATEMRLGHYIVLTGTTGAVAADTGVVSPGQAARIDRKMDDGVANTGGVVGENAGACQDGNGVWDEDNTDNTCSVAIRIQG